MPRLPADAYEQYLALPAAERSYSALSRRLGVSKRSIVARASREGWQERLRAVDEQSRQRAEKVAAEQTATITDRHLRTLRAIQAKALAGLQGLPLASGMDCVRALALTIKAERMILGTPDTRGAPAQPETPTLEDLLLEASARRQARLATEADPAEN